MKKRTLIPLALAAAGILLVTGVLTSQRQKTALKAGVPTGEEISGFSYENFESGLKLAVTGEAATIAPDRKTAVKAPAASFQTAEGKLILVNTGPSGTAEIDTDPKTGQMRTMLLKGGVTITRKDVKSGQVEFTAEGSQADYDYSRQEITLTGNPVVRQGNNEFRGETIRYFLKDGKIMVEKDASGKIQYEEKKP